MGKENGPKIEQKAFTTEEASHEFLRRKNIGVTIGETIAALPWVGALAYLFSNIGGLVPGMIAAAKTGAIIGGTVGSLSVNPVGVAIGAAVGSALGITAMAVVTRFNAI